MPISVNGIRMEITILSNNDAIKYSYARISINDQKTVLQIASIGRNLTLTIIYDSLAF